MKVRILTSIVATCILIPALMLSATPIFCAAVAAVAVIAIFEITRCIGVKKLYITFPVYLAALALPFLFRYSGNIYRAAVISFIFAAIYLMYLFTLAILSHGKLGFADISTLFCVSAYILAALTSIIYVRDFGEAGKYIYILIFLGAWITDIFAYFTGMLLGKHKLIPDVSPKKTIEGSIGGIFFCALSYAVFGIITDIFFGTDANILLLVLGGIVISVISQIGDLIMSVIKRHYGIKDYGKLFPGHGGILDRFDSILAVSLGVAMMCMVSGLLGINIL